MADFDEMNIGTEVENHEGLSKEDLAGAGLIGVAMIVGIGAYEGIKKGAHFVGEKLDKKGKNPFTAIKQKRAERKLIKQADKAAKLKARQEAIDAAAAIAAKEAESEEK